MDMTPPPPSLPLPGLALEPRAALDLLKCGADPVAQLLEPVAGGGFAVGKQVGHGEFPMSAGSI